MGRTGARDKRVRGERRQTTRREIDRNERVPPYIQNGKPLIRGSFAWNQRERARKRTGCQVHSWGEIEATW